MEQPERHLIMEPLNTTDQQNTVESSAQEINQRSNTLEFKDCKWSRDDFDRPSDFESQQIQPPTLFQGIHPLGRPTGLPPAPIMPNRITPSLFDSSNALQQQQQQQQNFHENRLFSGDLSPFSHNNIHPFGVPITMDQNQGNLLGPRQFASTSAYNRMQPRFDVVGPNSLLGEPNPNLLFPPH